MRWDASPVTQHQRSLPRMARHAPSVAGAWRSRRSSHAYTLRGSSVQGDAINRSLIVWRSLR